MRIETVQVKSNYKTTIAWGEVDGLPLTIEAITQKGWNADVKLVLKVKGYRPDTLTKIAGNYNVYDIPSLLEEIIDTDIISRWAYPLEDHAQFTA